MTLYKRTTVPGSARRVGDLPLGGCSSPSGWTVVAPGAHLGYGKSRDAIELL